MDAKTSPGRNFRSGQIAVILTLVTAMEFSAVSSKRDATFRPQAGAFKPRCNVLLQPGIERQDSPKTL